MHILLAKKEERIWFNIICLKIYPFERITWWCLYVLESIMGYVLEFALKFVLKPVMLKNIKKKCGLLKFASGPPLGGWLDENSGRP